MKLSLLILCLFSFVAEARFIQPDLSDFEDDVKMGMQKTEVIEALGSPRMSRRWKGKDRWIYIFHEENDDVVSSITKEIHFRAGVVVYKGKPPKVGVSAEEQDKINMDLVVADQKAWEAHQEKGRQSRKEYEDWVLKVKDQDGDPNRFVPKFQNID